MNRRATIVLITTAVIGIALVYGLAARPLRMHASVRVPRSEASARRLIEHIQQQAGGGSAWVVRNVVRLGLWVSGRSVLPGWYHIDSSASALDIARMIVTGKREPLVKITIPEGFSIREIAGRLRRRAEIDSAGFVSWCQADSVMRVYDVRTTSMEGFLMPDTYFVIRQDDVDDIGTMMARQAYRYWTQISRDMGITTWHDRLRTTTLASIVQLEAGQNDEMPRIAGVYHNRLRIGMLLQADPTVQYLTGKDRITGSELRNASNPYNTYVHTGLPPGPICNPGKEALRAVLRPESHEWIFFVARGDGSMRHRFARTLQEHNENVRLYRQNLRSSPPISQN